MKLQSINPHDQSVVGEVEVITPDQIKLVVDKAREVFKTWKFVPISERAEFIKKYRQKLVEHKEEIAKLITLEMGKPLHQSMDEVTGELDFIDYYANEGIKALSDEVVLKNEKESFRTVYEPYGVCAVIAPWNFPLSMFNSGVLPALIAGNTVLFKPSECTILSQKLMGELLLETGIPDGVFNLILGSKDTGGVLMGQDLDLVWFTGSTKVGQEIYQKCGQKFIKSICELGGSSAGIVFADADLDLTMENLYWARFLNTGQVCSAVKRLFVERPIFDQVVQRFKDRLSKVKLGNPLEEVDCGPLVMTSQLEKIEALVSDAVSKGAKVEIGGKRSNDPALSKGNYYEPTILTNITSNMNLMQEETFGPILPIVPFDNEEEAITMANNTEYGLSSEIYTTDLEKAERVAKRLESGVVAINTDNYYKPQCPIGGYKKSGIGREYGRVGMQKFAQIKLIAVTTA
jgi:acyl-CoA reductase-like NAD-dependent aldehyde dehydrogenase